MATPNKFDALASAQAEAQARMIERANTIGFDAAQSVARRFKEEADARLEQADLARRTAAAVEASATVATESKRGADAALMWARIAALISLAALIVSSWPYISAWWT